MSIAFFDLDKTILAENSAKLWLKSQWNSRQIKLSQMITASYFLAKYHLGFTKLEEVIEKGLAMVAGEQKSFVMGETEQFYHDTVKKLYRPGALEAIEEHKQLGHVTSLLTSSFDGLSLLVKQDLRLDHCLSTRLEVDEQGLYTGKTLGPLCFGKNKVQFAKELCEKLGISLRECTFYTDSASDIPLLYLVGRAVAVNPDPHLRARAQLYKWEIVDWGRPEWAKTRQK